jgi:hypothetical protein
MIRLPRRSVTRFFIPLIDVLLLLFCIFLLMPLVRATGEGAAAGKEVSREDRLRELEAEVERLRRQQQETPRDLRDELDRLRQEKLKTLQERLAIRVLEIDPATGRLYYHDPERVEITNQARATELIQRDRSQLGDRNAELYYLILYPRDPSSPFPHREQRERYERWFADVAHGWDVPGRTGDRRAKP